MSHLSNTMPSSSSSSQYEFQDYFVPGYEISRHIIFQHIQYYLGPQASVRPYSFRGREGYLVTAPGQPLTRSQIEDLQSLSRQYEIQAAERMMQPGSGAYSDFGSSGYGEENYINRPVRVEMRRR